MPPEEPLEPEPPEDEPDLSPAAMLTWATTPSKGAVIVAAARFAFAVARAFSLTWTLAAAALIEAVVAEEESSRSVSVSWAAVRSAAADW